MNPLRGAIIFILMLFDTGPDIFVVFVSPKCVFLCFMFHNSMWVWSVASNNVHCFLLTLMMLACHATVGNALCSIVTVYDVL